MLFVKRQGGGNLSFPSGFISELDNITSDDGLLNQMMALLGAEYFEILDGVVLNYGLYCQTSFAISSIKLIIAISNDYLSGVSSSAAMVETGYCDIYVAYDINGLTGYVVQTSKSYVVGGSTGTGLTVKSGAKNIQFEEDYSNYNWMYRTSGYKVFVFY